MSAPKPRPRQSPEIRIGTSGWIYRHWRGRFYPQKLPAARWFAYYASHFDTVELNYTFYRLPPPNRFDVWRQQAPDGFRYAVKASRFLTHMKKLKDPAEPIRRLLSRCARLKQHLGPILYQLPPGWRRDRQRLRDFCRQLPRGLVHVFEFRDRDWLHPEIFEILEETGMSLCVHDMLPKHPIIAFGPVAYVRFHGTTGKYGGSYTRTQLRHWARRVEQFAAQGRSVYLFFNNDAQAHAVQNALVLKQLLGLARAAEPAESEATHKPRRARPSAHRP